MTMECESHGTKDIESYVISHKCVGHCDNNDKKILLKFRLITIGKISDIYLHLRFRYRR